MAEGNRVEYRRGGVTEWYVNGPLGIEQGFTVAERPAALAAGRPLRVELEQAGTLRAEMEDDGRGLVLRGAGGTAVLAYRGLAAWDAKGQELPARLELAGATIAIEVDDAGAKYPVTIDPFVQQAKLTASDGAASDVFGSSVAIDGDTVVVGAPFDDIGGNGNQGSAYVFVKPASGWADMTETAKLTASDGAAGDEFGFSVSISGDTVLVGARNDDIGANTDQGSAYVFVKPVTGWADMTETAKLTASDGLGGFSVAIDSDTVVVGAPGYESGGSAYVFVEPGAGWAGTLTETAKLTASDGAAGDGFGYSAAVSGDTVVVGAYGDDTFRGSAYVFVKPGTGWADMTETAKLTASDGQEFDVFGASWESPGTRWW